MLIIVGNVCILNIVISVMVFVSIYKVNYECDYIYLVIFVLN